MTAVCWFAYVRLLITPGHLLASGLGGCTQAATQFVWLGIQHILASPLAPYPSTVVNQPQNTSADRKPVSVSLSQLQIVGQMYGRLNGWFDEQHVCRVYTCVSRTYFIRHYVLKSLNRLLPGGKKWIGWVNVVSGIKM